MKPTHVLGAAFGTLVLVTLTGVRRKPKPKRKSLAEIVGEQIVDVMKRPDIRAVMQARQEFMKNDILAKVRDELDMSMLGKIPRYTDEGVGAMMSGVARIIKVATAEGEVRA